MNEKSAEILAIDALGYLAGDPERLGRFLAVSGVGPEVLQQNAGDPQFLAGVLDYLLADESLLFMFAEAKGIGVEQAARARQHLPGAPTEQQGSA